MHASFSSVSRDKKLNRFTRAFSPTLPWAKSKAVPKRSCAEPSGAVRELADSPNKNSVAESNVNLKNKGWRSTVEPSLGILVMRV